MGYDIDRFTSAVDDELICPICAGVFDEPLQILNCEHIFCKKCIQVWLNHQLICPVDRETITPNLLGPVPRILKNLLSKLIISCENKSFGCVGIFSLESLPNHMNECQYNQKKLVTCESGCGFVATRDKLKEHNCVKELHGILQKQKQKIKAFQLQINEDRLIISDLRREINILKDYMKVLRLTNPSVHTVINEMEFEEIIFWSNNLARARVSRWGGMISTPDEYLQGSIRIALRESGCPSHIIDNLMENCHERNWPAGLSSLETRQSKRREYEKYVCRRIPFKQAVVVLRIDNPFLNDDFIKEPGLVMIFAHGVE